MKFVATVFAMMVFAVGVSSSYAEVHFESATFKQALKKAAKGHKVVMVDLYTDWCGWCKRLDRDTYSNDAVGAYTDANMVSLKMDAEHDGAELAQQGHVQGYPTILFFDENGNEIHRLVGYQKPDQFLATLKTAVQKNGAKSAVHKGASN